MLTLSLGHLAAFNLALLAALLSPGPAMLYAVREAVGGGARSGLVAALGLGASAALWTIAALFGLATLFALFPWLYAGVKFAGAAFLIWIAWTTWRGADKPVAATETRGRWRFARAFCINLGNPKSALFAAAVLAVVFPPDMTLADKAIIAANQFALEVAFYSACALAMSRKAIASAYMRAKRRLDRVSALIMGGLGLRLALSN